jgi:DNA-directed RNA polymerase subunit RPC12/RpoP
MAENQLEVIKGMMCPGCGGTVDLQEGSNVVKCPYCETSLLVQGDEGVLQYHVHSTIGKDQARDETARWLGKFDKDRKLKQDAEFTDIFLVHIPFWRSIGRVCGWIFGNKIHRETHKDSKGITHTTTRKEPVERMIMEDHIWNKAACDVSEFGVEKVDESGIAGKLEPFDLETVEKQGMVFEPTFSRSDAVLESEEWMLQQARKHADVDEVIFQKLHTIGTKLSVVYYPLWVLRYTFKDRNYQVVVDGIHGKLVYGRAPGSTMYRVGMFVGSLMIGNLILTTSVKEYFGSSGNIFIIGGLAGAALILFGFVKFRYGGEIVQGGKSKIKGEDIQETLNSLKDGTIGDVLGLGVR